MVDKTITTIDKDDFDYKYKVIVMGDIHCGKTTLLDSNYF